MEMRGGEILVTGGASLIGFHSGDSLVSQDIREIVVDDNVARRLAGSLAGERMRINEKLINLSSSGQPMTCGPRNQPSLVRKRMGSPVEATHRIGSDAGVSFERRSRRLVALRKVPMPRSAVRRSAAR